MSEHTPGPWFVVNTGTEDEPMMEVRAERIRGRGPTHSVALCATGDSPQAMEDANARLISKAWLLPEMVEALREDIRNCGCAGDDTCFPCERNRLFLKRYEEQP